MALTGLQIFMMILVLFAAVMAIVSGLYMAGVIGGDSSSTPPPTAIKNTQKTKMDGHRN